MCRLAGHLLIGLLDMRLSLAWADIRGREMVRTSSQRTEPHGRPDPGPRRKLLRRDGVRRAFGRGTLFKIYAVGTLTTLNSFSGSDFRAPNGLIQAGRPVSPQGVAQRAGDTGATGERSGA